MTDWIEAGMKAPEFTLPADDGASVTLSSLRGRPVVVYFYPEDDTPGCTLEACAFRDAMDGFEVDGATVLGISPDDVASHAAFRAKYGLNFRLLADVGHVVAETYGAWREKNMYGRTTIGIQRSTFLIDAEGIVRRVWKRVKVEGHADRVAAALRAL